jgi:polysaccharide export outer membrane protein
MGVLKSIGMLILVVGSVCVFALTGGRAFAQSAYLLNPGDTLQISVWKEPDLQREVLILPDSQISFPLVGFIDTAGKTAADVQVEITKRLGKYISNPVVTVSVANVNGNRIYVIGKVKQPGEYVVERFVDVMQALSLAGGLTPFASADDIRILRRTPKGQTAIAFEYSDVSDGEKLQTNIILHSGDIVVVP